MWKQFLSFVFLVSVGVNSANAAIITHWTFQVSGTTATSNSRVAEVGAFASTSVASTNSGGTISSPGGNGSTLSFSSNGWAPGEYYQFSTSTTGFDGITLSYAQAASATGPRTFSFQYSTDGVNFTLLPDYTGPTSDFSAANFNALNVISHDLSSITALNNASTAVFRIAVAAGSLAENGNSIAGTGTFRVDDFILNGNITAVPEPTSVALVSLAGCLGLVATYRRRLAKTAKV